MVVSAKYFRDLDSEGEGSSYSTTPMQKFLTKRGTSACAWSSLSFSSGARFSSWSEYILLDGQYRRVVARKQHLSRLSTEQSLP